MKPGLSWFFAIVRIAGVSFPGTASLVQLQAELDAAELERRLERLEDPISRLHDDVPALSEVLYDLLKANARIALDDEDYRRFSRALAVLDKEGMIRCRHVIGRHNPIGIDLVDPTFVMYMCRLFEDQAKMDLVFKRLDGCAIGEWINGIKLAEETGLPRPVVAACFDIFERKGFGIRSREIGSINYCGRA